ncbi:MAG: hypothetical protein Q8M16_01235 [Pirellulaceae bacterium]|nr:hypothetical protein [Pirellulaceae bacterium]
MNALTWDFIVLLLIVGRLVRLGGRGVVFLWNQLLLAAESPRRLSMAGNLCTGRWLRTKFDGGLIDRAWLSRPHWTRGGLEDRLLNLFATYRLLESLVFVGTMRSRLQVACLKSLACR